MSNLKLAERGAIISISTYLLLSAAKLATGHLLHSSSLVADGFNNVSDIIGNVALLIGIRMARQPADRDHRFGHWKIEDLASLITSIIMFYVGFDVLRDTIQKILSREQTVIDPLGATLGVVSAAVMFAVYLYNTGDTYSFMENDTGEIHEIAADTIEDITGYLKDNLDVFIQIYKGNVINVILPSTISYTITETVPGIKGNRAQSGTKPATIETGMEIQVPLHKEVGDTVTLNTLTGGVN